MIETHKFLDKKEVDREKKEEKIPDSLFEEIVELPDFLKLHYLPSLDGFRAISITIVIVFHLLMSFGSRFRFDNLANLGVQFFFVISGFLITTLLMKEQVKQGRISLKKFYVRRFFRIVPVAFLYLIVVLLSKLFFVHSLNLIFILSSFLFIRNYFWNATGIDHLTTHYWSLSVEEQFYLVFPILLKTSIKFYICFLLSIIVFGLFSDLAIRLHFIEQDATSFLQLITYSINQFQGIAIGSLTSILLIKRRVAYDYEHKTLIISILFIFILLLSYNGSFGNLRNILRCVSFAFILIICLKESKSIYYNVLNKKKVKLIGVLSFSLYIWQQPFTLNIGFFNSTSYIVRLPNKVPIDIFIIVLSVICLGFISWVSYFYFEKKFLRLKERFK
jgi:peptidoglycan/LPS O-acetylase OafA/YrhL